MSKIADKPETLEDHEGDLLVGGSYLSNWDIHAATSFASNTDDVVQDSSGQITLIRT